MFMVQLFARYGGECFFVYLFHIKILWGLENFVFFLTECPACFPVFLYLYAKGAFYLVWAAIDF